jgi:hypothetical protein
MAPKRRLIEPADRRLAGVKLTLSRKCKTAAVDPKATLDEVNVAGAALA